MLLSRFWYLFLSLAAAVAVGAALLAQGTVNRVARENVDDALSRDRFETEQTLKLDARARIDAIAPLAAHPDVRAALRQASAASAENPPPAEAHNRLKTTLRELNAQLRGMSGDVLFAVDKAGVIVAQIGPNEARFGASLETYPLVRRALAGYVRDDVWDYDGVVYRMAARPVIDGGAYVGAILHGKKFDAQLCDALGQRLPGATVVFFKGTEPIADHTPVDVAHAPAASEIGIALDAVFHDETFQKEGRSEAIALSSGGRSAFALVTGSAAQAQVGYAIARPLTLLASPTDLFSRATQDDFDALPTGALIATALALFAFGMLFLYLEKNRPMMKFRSAVARLAGKETDRLEISSLTRSYRKIGEQINEALERGGKPKKKIADLGKILGASGAEEAPASSFFGFAAPEDRPSGVSGETVRAQSVPPPPTVRSLATEPPPREEISPAGRPVPSISTPVVPPPTRPAPPMKAAPPPPPPVTARNPKSTLLGVPAVPVEGGGPIQGPGAQSFSDLSVASEIPDDPDDGPSDATMVAHIPQELLAAASGQGQRALEEAAEEAHFREVFDDFFATKKQQGESVDGLTLAKFAQTLRKNKEQIVQRQGVKTVRFSVYLKEGKAAIKATPVRE